MRPIYIVEGEGFRKCMKKMEPSYTFYNGHLDLGAYGGVHGCHPAIPNYKRVAVVHDNASNMKLCTETLKKEPEKWGNVQGVYCSGHTLQLCINTALKQDRIRRTVAAARNLVGHFRKSAKATAALKDKQKQQNVVAHKLTNNVATRGNSTCEMLDRLVSNDGQ
ncbi:hypothetical protein JOQ06_010669 [Pogonophryne albipinna]|uniref:Uncharacterized protein n=1 Tax=Pogonophryne albipinna TaxID=1090488 RepID=A0AAD6FFY5_9TELE|nr:hypothetical protein JOQ06_010669 [Pogonophryne albipinna]